MVLIDIKPFTAETPRAPRKPKSFLLIRVRPMRPLWASIWKFVYDSFQAALQNWNMEVYQEADFFMSEAQVRQKLCFVNWKQFLDGLDFHDNFVFDDQIQAISAIEFYIFVNHR